MRLLTRLMESAAKPWLGYGADDTSVEASVYRTVLERTGLHREQDAAWSFARPGEVAALLADFGEDLARFFRAFLRAGAGAAAVSGAAVAVLISAVSSFIARI